EDLGPAGDGVAGSGVEGDLEARRRPRGDPRDIHGAVALARDEVPRVLGDGEERLDEVPPREPFPEGLDVLLVMPVDGARRAVPQQLRVQRVRPAPEPVDGPEED